MIFIVAIVLVEKANGIQSRFTDDLRPASINFLHKTSLKTSRVHFDVVTHQRYLRMKNRSSFTSADELSKLQLENILLSINIQLNEKKIQKYQFSY